MFYVNLCPFIVHHFVNIKLTSLKENSLHFGKVQFTRDYTE